jgi:hypothetical protein
MQLFIDPATQQQYALDDDVVVTTKGKVTTCTSARGEALTLPTTLVPYVSPAPTAADLAAQFAANKAAALIAVDQFHANTVQQLAGNPTQVEKDSWAMKLSTANAVIAKATVSAEGIAFMTALGLIAPVGATAAQVTAADAAKATWAARVQANAAKFAGLVGLADNLRTQAKAAITAAVDQVALDAAQAANKATALAAIAAFPKV